MWEGLAPLRADFPTTRWMRPDVLHLTLVFMGEVDAARVPDLAKDLDKVASRHVAYETRVDGAGGHIDDGPGRRPGGVAWLTLAAGFKATADLADDVDVATGARMYNDRQRPGPHLTVARAVDAAVLAALRDLAPTLRLEWPTSSIVLFRSHLGPGGSRYEPLSTHELKEGSLTHPAQRA